MKNASLLLAFVLTLMLGFTPAHASATPDQAKAFAEKASAFANEAGTGEAIKEFNDHKGKFVKGDLYIFAMDFNGVMLAHGTNAKLVNQNVLEMKDVDGKALFVEMINVAKTKGTGWVDYKWLNPETKKLQQKTTYIIRVKDIFLGCGAYK